MERVLSLFFFLVIFMDSRERSVLPLFLSISTTSSDMFFSFPFLFLGGRGGGVWGRVGGEKWIL